MKTEQGSPSEIRNGFSMRIKGRLVPDSGGDKGIFPRRKEERGVELRIFDCCMLIERSCGGKARALEIGSSLLSVSGSVPGFSCGRWHGFQCPRSRPFLLPKRKPPAGRLPPKRRRTRAKASPNGHQQKLPHSYLSPCSLWLIQLHRSGLLRIASHGTSALLCLQ